MKARVTYLGKGNRKVAIDVGVIVLFPSGVPVECSDSAIAFAKAKNETAGEKVYEIEYLEVPTTEVKKRKLPSGHSHTGELKRQKDIDSPLYSKRNLQDVIADKRRGSGLK